MIYLHAALVLHSGGQKITADSLKAIVKAAGVKPDDAQVNSLVSVLEGVNIDEVISAPMLMAAAPATAPAAAAPAASKGAAKEEKKEEAKSDSDLGLDSLFG